MGGSSGINLSPGRGGNNLPGGMVGWNNINNVNNGYINGWPGQIGWNNINNVGINSPIGMVNGRRPGTMIGFNNINNVGNIGNGVGNVVNGRRYPNYPNYPMVGVNNNINIGHGYDAGYDQAMEMANAMSGMGNFNMNNGGWPGSQSTKRKGGKKGGWWRKR
jgi:hypothetical protein